MFGGEVIRGFTFAMLFGIVIGTYSSIFIAAPLLLLFGVKRDWSGAGRARSRPRADAAAQAARREKRGLEMTRRAARYPGRAPIDAYGNGGFRFAEMSHRGSILCLPSGIYAWHAARAGRDRRGHARAGAGRAGRARSAAARHRPAPQLPGAEVRRAFAAAGMALEAMDTGAACRTYNVLLAEGRPVARGADRAWS